MSAVSPADGRWTRQWSPFKPNKFCLRRVANWRPNMFATHQSLDPMNCSWYGPEVATSGHGAAAAAEISENNSQNGDPVLKQTGPCLVTHRQAVHEGFGPNHTNSCSSSPKTNRMGLQSQAQQRFTGVAQPLFLLQMAHKHVIAYCLTTKLWSEKPSDTVLRVNLGAAHPVSATFRLDSPRGAPRHAPSKRP